MKGALKDGKPTSEAREGENNFLLSGFPHAPEFAGDVSCLLAITYNEKTMQREASKIEDVPAIFPACWGGQFSPHFVKAEDDFFETYGWTHLAVLEGPDYGVYFQGSIYFGHGRIVRPFLVLGFNENDGSYHHLHCVDCCHGIAEFFMENQPRWKQLYDTLGSKFGATPNATRH